jgi:hypothetical protein
MEKYVLSSVHPLFFLQVVLYMFDGCILYYGGQREAAFYFECGVSYMCTKRSLTSLAHFWGVSEK